MQLLQVFDTNADCLTPTQFNEFILPYLAILPKLVKARLEKLGVPCPPMTVFAKGAHAPEQLAALSESGYDTIGIDWSITARTARESTSLCLQGNLDPPVLHAGRPAIARAVHELVWGKDGFLTVAKESSNAGEQAKSGGWIVNLGHGITPGVDPEDMRYFLQCVRDECAKAKQS